MRKTYALAIEKAHGLVALDLPLMTLTQAEKARATLAQYGKAVLVINRAAV